MEHIHTFTLDRNEHGQPINPVSSYIFETVVNNDTLDKEILEDFIKSTGLDCNKTEIFSDILSKSQLETVKPYYLFSTILYKLLYTSQLDQLLQTDTSLIPAFQERVELNIQTLVSPFLEMISQERKATEEAKNQTLEEKKAKEKAEKALKKTLNDPFSVLSTSPISTYAHNNTKVARYIHDGTLGTEIFPFDQPTLFAVMKKDKLTTACTVRNEFYDTGNLEFSSKPPSPFDKEVYDAISSHYEVGNTALTIPMIYRAMTGKGSKQKPTVQQGEAIANSIEKMGMLRVKIDCTAELKARGADITLGKLDSIALDYRALEGISNNGKEFSYYQFKSEPILFTYAKAVQQIISIPMELLNTPKNNTEELFVVKKYLLERIYNMKSNKSKLSQHTILVQHIYDFFGAETPNAKRKARNNIEPFLDYWISKDFIKGYHYVLQGKAIHAVFIQLKLGSECPALEP